MTTMDARERIALRLLREALDVEDGGERERFLVERCGGDAALRTRVDGLLAGVAASEAGDAHTADDANGDDSTDSLVGTHLGAFRVLERVCRGGMGVVYRGVREGADFAQEVALKLIRRGFDFDDIRARFLRERRILARLDHPHLARFIDGGVASDGRPWFALEFVRGEPITRWCDAQRLDVRARVQLFLDVCAAVQHAHAQLVVHRDLKPANILVGDDGRVRLLDFGIARLVGGEDDATAQTTIGHRYALTPEYAAPEQFAGDIAGVATDVYALGAILYELVVGVLPLAVERGDLLAAAHVVCTTPPPALAAAMFRGAGDDAIVAQRLAARATTARGYRRDTRGDLSRIVDKALAKEPARRYPTVDAFAEDLSRWLAGSPVRVSGNGVGYRLGKFIRRYRLPVAIAAIAIVGIASGIVGTLWQEHRAVVSAGRANAMRTYLVELFETNLPGSAIDRIPDTRTLLERGVDRARSELRDQPELQADMLGTLGRIEVRLGLYDQAEVLLQDALALRHTLGQMDEPESADVLLDLARIHRQRHRVSEARERLVGALAIVAGSDPARESEVRQQLGIVLALDDRLEEGIAEMHSALVLRAQVEQPPGARAAQILSDLGFILERGGRYEDALAADRQSLALSRRQYGDTHADVAGTLSNIGECLRKLGRFDEAEEALREAVTIDSRVYATPSSRHAVHLGNLAAVLIARGKFTEGEHLMREALRMREALYGGSDPQSAKSMINLGAVLLRQNKVDEGIETYRRAAEIFESDHGDWRSELAYVYQNLARGLSVRHEWVAAEANARHALELRSALDGENGVETVQARAALGTVLLDAGHAREARDAFGRALASSLAFIPPNPSRLAERYAELARAEAALGDDTSAGTHFENSLRMAAGALEDGNPVVIQARLDYATTLLRQRQDALADEQLRRSEAATRSLPSDHPLRMRVDAAVTQRR